MEEGYASWVSLETKLCDEKERESVSLTRLCDKKGVSALFCYENHVVVGKGAKVR